MANKARMAKVAEMICIAGLVEMAIKPKKTRMTELAKFATWSEWPRKKK